MIRERQANVRSGLSVLLVLLVAIPAIVVAQVTAARAGAWWGIHVGLALLLLLDVILLFGLFVVAPNEARVLTLFGNYFGSVRNSGLWWANPFCMKRRVSLRVRNFESAKLKVNDSLGNPIEIAAVVVWRVVDSAEALFEVDSYDNFMHVQSESALRNLATSHPYDAHVDGQMSLRAGAGVVAEQLKTEIQDRLHKAGIDVIEARISHLAYAQEIASAMLRRQQAEAVIAARTKIVEGAVSMVQMALDQLGERGIVQLDEERKAAMVSNLLVVLCSEHEMHPVINAGTLHN
jgi:regulator of protease activity HflC (stomatin/prohibitin superfamily)